MSNAQGCMHRRECGGTPPFEEQDTKARHRRGTSSRAKMKVQALGGRQQDRRLVHPEGRRQQKVLHWGVADHTGRRGKTSV